MATEHTKAQWWRRNVIQLTPRALAEATGFSERAVYLFEAGATNTGAPHSKRAWLRYKRACQAVDVEHRIGHEFTWGIKSPA